MKLLLNLKYVLVFSALLIGAANAFGLSVELETTRPIDGLVSESEGDEKNSSFNKNIKAYQGTDWRLTNHKGQAITLSDYQGQPVMLVFWATWCPYCKKLLPGIAELNEQYAAKGLKIIAVNILEDWKPKVYWRNHGYTFDTVLDGDQVAKIYAIKATPSIVFIEPSGKVLGVKSFSDPHHPLLKKFAEAFID